MIEVEYVAVINRPCEEVFAFVSNPENETQWQSGLIEAKQTSDGPMGVASTGRDVRRIMGKKTVAAWRITKFEPNRQFAFAVISGPMPFQGSYAFETVDDGTRVTCIIQAQTAGFSKLFDPVVSRLIKRQGEKQIAALKQVLEARV